VNGGVAELLQVRQCLLPHVLCTTTIANGVAGISQAFAGQGFMDHIADVALQGNRLLVFGDGTSVVA
jgi:hypothetical protein